KQFLELAAVRLGKNKFVIGAVLAEERLEIFYLDNRAGEKIRRSQQEPANFHTVRRNRLKGAPDLMTEAFDYIELQMNANWRPRECPGIERRSSSGLRGGEFL